MRSVVKFLQGGDKVKITLRFRGREMAHADLGRKLLERVAEDVNELGKIEAIPRLEGRQMVMMINPVKHWGPGRTLLRRMLARPPRWRFGRRSYGKRRTRATNQIHAATPAFTPRVHWGSLFVLRGRSC